MSCSTHLKWCIVFDNYILNMFWNKKANTFAKAYKHIPPHKVQIIWQHGLETKCNVRRIREWILCTTTLEIGSVGVLITHEWVYRVSYHDETFTDEVQIPFLWWMLTLPSSGKWEMFMRPVQLQCNWKPQKQQRDVHHKSSRHNSSLSPWFSGFMFLI